MRYKIAFLVSIIVPILACTPNAYSQWIQVNGVGGSVVNSFVIRGSSIYAGTNGGVIVSNDSGQSWTSIDSGIAYSNVRVMASIGQNIMAGTDSAANLTTDNGISWKVVGLQNGSGLANLRGFAVLGAQLFAATGDGGGVYISSDSGETWKRSNTVLQGHAVFSLAAGGTQLLAGTDIGIFRSIDSGKSWNAVNNGLPNLASILSVAIVGANLFAGTNAGGIFLSTNNGETWAPCNSGLPYSGYHYQLHDTVPYFSAVNALVSDGTDLYVGMDLGVWHTTNNGTNWQEAEGGLSNRVTKALALNGRLLLAGTAGDGVFRSSNAGINWTASNSGLTGLYLTSLMCDGANLFAGSGGQVDQFPFGGILLSTDFGKRWKPINPQTVPASVRSIAVLGDNLFIGAGGDIPTVLRSSNNGTSWVSAISGFGTADYVFALAAYGTDIYAGSFGGGVFRSRDSGANWTALDSGLTKSVTCLAVEGNALFAGTYSGVFRSTNSGNSWEAVRSGLFDTVVFALAVIGDDLFAGTVNGGGVFLSTDMGTNWKQIHPGLPQGVYVYTFATSGKNLFVGTSGGVFFTSDFGTSWNDVNPGLPNTGRYAYVTNLAVDTSYLFAVTYSGGSSTNGVWRRPLSQMIGLSKVNSSPHTECALVVNPNPVSERVRLQVSSNKHEAVEIGMVNLLGKEIARIFSGNLDPGTHSYEWDANDVTDGVYFCIVRSESGVVEVPLVVRH